METKKIAAESGATEREGRVLSPEVAGGLVLVGAMLFRLGWVLGDIPERGLPSFFEVWADGGRVPGGDASLSWLLTGLAVLHVLIVAGRMVRQGEGPAPITGWFVFRTAILWLPVVADAPWEGGCLLSLPSPFYPFLFAVLARSTMRIALEASGRLAILSGDGTTARLTSAMLVLGMAVVLLLPATAKVEAFNSLNQAVFLYGALHAAVLVWAQERIE